MIAAAIILLLLTFSPLQMGEPSRCISQRNGSNVSHTVNMINAPKPIPALTEKDKARFVAKVDRDTPHPKGCWLWTASKSPSGYGQFGIRRSVFKAHRIAYVIRHGVSPESLHVIHSCDNPSCCNPSHLSAATHTENMRDMFAKGRRPTPSGDSHHARKNPERMARGEQNGGCKLTEKTVLKIRAMHTKGGMGCRRLAKHFGISKTQTLRIINARSWAHV